MRLQLIFTLFVSMLFHIATLNATSVYSDTIPTVTKAYRYCEQQPEYPEGSVALRKWIRANMVYPPNAKRDNVEGTVYVEFIVEKDGSLTDIHIAKGIKALNTEAIRLVRMMPKWKCGRNSGRHLRVIYTLPIEFRLDNKYDINQNESGIALVIKDFKLTPTSGNRLINVRFKSTPTPLHITIYDLQGKLLQTINKNDFSGEFDEIINLSDTPSGMLLLSIRQNGKIYTEKITAF